MQWDYLGGRYILGVRDQAARLRQTECQDSRSAKNVATCNSGAAGPILTKADASDGQSGGPLWQLPEADGIRYMYGVLSAGSDTDTLFAGRTAFVNAIAQARSAYP